MQPYNSIICGHFCIRFIDLMLKGRSLLAKSKLYNSIEVWISEALIYSKISHDGFILIYNVLKEWRCERRNQKFKDLNSSLKILVYL